LGAEVREIAPEDVLPEAHRPGASGGSERAPVWAEGDALDGTLMTVQGLAELGVGADIPQHDRPVAAGGSEYVSLRAERDAEEAALVAV
jgi:hypothetical protein